MLRTILLLSLQGRLDFCRKEIAQLRQRVSSQPVGITEAKTIVSTRKYSHNVRARAPILLV